MRKLLTALPAELKYEVWGIILFTTGAISIISLLGLNDGIVCIFFAKALKYLFGVGAPAVPCLLLLIGSRYIWRRKPIFYSPKFIGYVVVYFCLLALFHHFRIPAGSEIMPDSLIPGGGFAGGLLLFLLRKLIGIEGAFLALCALTICALVLSTRWSLSTTLWQAKEKADAGLHSAKDALNAEIEAHREQQDFNENCFDKQARHKTAYDQADYVTTVPEPAASPNIDADCTMPVPMAAAEPHPGISYVLPSLTLLDKPVKPGRNKLNKEINEHARILEETLDDFGVSAKIVDTSQGPAVTRYELELAAGVKVSKILNLADDLALKLASIGIRIEAPIPGKAAVGIEVPNKTISPVPLRDVLETKGFHTAASFLSVALGKDITGNAVIADIGKMPHLLVAGATGSGKSVCINTIIASILFRAGPDDVKFVLIDPKVVELSVYNGIPHLLTPVVTDCQKAASALNWAVQEMEKRYKLFAAAGVRDVSRYNQFAAKNDVEKTLPLIVVIIDELADLMMAAPVDVEAAICRLAQKARAAGLHLILATQRPSVDVVTGTIKANIPSRISFAVSSQIDSRTILDMAGAEKLLGKGDMLFYPVGAAKPLRVQGAFISDDEVEKLVYYIKQQESEIEYVEGVTTCTTAVAGQTADDDIYQDELLEDAVHMIIDTGQASASMLQRRFRIGYARAARLIDTLEGMKIVGPSNGSKGREILMTSEQIFSRYFQKE